MLGGLKAIQLIHRGPKIKPNSLSILRYNSIIATVHAVSEGRTESVLQSSYYNHSIKLITWYARAGGIGKEPFMEDSLISKWAAFLEVLHNNAPFKNTE